MRRKIRMPDKKKPEIKEKAIRLIWDSPEGLPAYANQIQVTHAGGNDFHIYFGYVAPPLTHGLKEEIEEMPDKLSIKPLTNIVITPDMMRAIVQVLSDNLDKYDEREKGKDK